jgi:hypothetical protein
MQLDEAKNSLSRYKYSGAPYCPLLCFIGDGYFMPCITISIAIHNYSCPHSLTFWQKETDNVITYFNHCSPMNECSDPH